MRYISPLATVWIILVLASGFEVGWAIGLKYSDGFSRPVHSLVYVSMILSVTLLGIAMKGLPIGTVYAIWTGVGTIGTALLGVCLFDESATISRLACIGLIAVGILGLGFCK